MTTEILNIAGISASGEGNMVDIAKGVPPMRRNAACRFYLDVPTLVGVSVLVEILTEVEGKDYVLNSFALLTAVGRDTLVIEGCPRQVKAKYTLTSVTDCDIKVHADPM